jgi:uncharacterized membrane protein
LLPDPYATPRAHVADLPSPGTDGEFIAAGQSLPAGHGWQWLIDGFGFFKRQPGMWIVLIVTAFLAFSIIAFIPLIGGVVPTLFGPVVWGGLLIGCRELERGAEIEFGHLFAGFHDHLGKLVLIGLFNLVAFIAIIFIAGALGGVGVGAMFGLMGGSPEAGSPPGGAMVIGIAMLIMLALMVPVYMAIWFAPALVIFNELGVADALKTSFAVCLKNIVPFLLYGVIFVGLAVIASVPFFLGWLVLAPTIAASTYAGYRDIFYARDASAPRLANFAERERT